jgi:hypothetical protein
VGVGITGLGIGRMHTDKVVTVPIEGPPPQLFACSRLGGGARPAHPCPGDLPTVCHCLVARPTRPNRASLRAGT